MLKTTLNDREYLKFREATGTDPITGQPQDKIAVVIEQPTSNPIPVYVTENAGAVFIAEYSELNVTQNVETTILTYTVPATKKLVTNLISFTGENIGEYFIYVNASKKYTTRTNFGSDLSRDVPIKFELDAGDFISIKVNNPRASTVKYCATINGELF